MPSTKPTTIAAYMKGVPTDRREALEQIRAVVNKNIDKPFEEGMQYGMPSWYVPHSVYPEGYHCDPKQPLPFASIANQKNHIGLYLFCVYQDKAVHDWFVDAWKASGKKLDMGKSCVRVKDLDGVPLDVLAKLFKKVKAKAYIASYDAVRHDKSKTEKKTSKKTASKKTNLKKTPKKVAKKKTTKKTSR
ncbi:MAG: DUF1801 domain-containing protein [Phycisphaerales bacterium]|nr:DUF1801 domain-containing protein [Phycisphaerales bacterium]